MPKYMASLTPQTKQIEPRMLLSHYLSMFSPKRAFSFFLKTAINIMSYELLWHILAANNIMNENNQNPKFTL